MVISTTDGVHEGFGNELLIILKAGDVLKIFLLLFCVEADLISVML